MGKVKIKFWATIWCGLFLKKKKWVKYFAIFQEINLYGMWLEILFPAKRKWNYSFNTYLIRFCFLQVFFFYLKLCSASLASLTRETGPKVVKGDPAKKSETPKVAHVSHHYFTPNLSISDSALKFTHVLYNLSPAGIKSHVGSKASKIHDFVLKLFFGVKDFVLKLHPSCFYYCLVISLFSDVGIFWSFHSTLLVELMGRIDRSVKACSVRSSSHLSQDSSVSLENYWLLRPVPIKWTHIRLTIFHICLVFLPS